MDRRTLVRGQGVYYVASGLFPLISMKLFERITGPKRDEWLVQMVALLAVTIGASLLVGTQQEDLAPATLTLSVASALSFTGIDVIHAARKRISPIYLADAASEVVLLCLLVRSYFD